MTIYETLAGQATDALIANKLTELQAWLSARMPTLDVKDPALVSIWLGPLAEHLVENQLVLDSIDTFGQLSVNILNGISDDAIAQQLRDALADSLLVSSVPASRAVGELALTFRTEQSVSLPRGSLFYYGSIAYATTAPITIRAVSQLIGSDAEQPLYRLADGNWQSVIAVVAVESGEIANIAEGTELTAGSPLNGLVSITASGSFVGGRDQNAIQDLIDAVFNHTAFRTMGTRDQIVALLQTRTEIGGVRQCGVIGFGDPEMQRDRLFGFPMGGGCADIYLAAIDYPTAHTVAISGVVTSITDNQATFRVGVGRNISPGYLRVLSAELDGEVLIPLTIKSEQRGLDLSPLLGEQVPTIEAVRHGVFSRFQTATLDFTGPLQPDMQEGQTVTIRVRFQRINGLEVAQSIATSRTTRYLTGDTLVRSAIPVFLGVSIRLVTSFDAEVSNADLIRAGVVEAVMRRPMRSHIHSSDIIQSIARYLPESVAVDRIDFEGLMVRPDGESRRISSSGVFICPDDPAQQITSRTVAIYTVSSQVKISVEQLLTLETP